MDEARVEARARELWNATFLDKMGGGLPWERGDDRVRDVFRAQARREFEFVARFKDGP